MNNELLTKYELLAMSGLIILLIIYPTIA